MAANSSSDDEEVDYQEEKHEEDGQEGYMYEPLAVVRETDDGENTATAAVAAAAAEAEAENRLGKTNWCLCGHCQAETERVACRCCREVKELEVLRSAVPEGVRCITEHPGFQANCLNTWVLDAVYNHYRVQYGAVRGSREERYRYTAYRNLVFWAFGWLGKRNRVPLPSCVVRRIRSAFPSDLYKGFQE